MLACTSVETALERSLAAPANRVRAWLLGPTGLILGAFAGSRLLVLFAAVAAEGLVPRNPRLTSGAAGPILTSLTAWDGWWYLGIARNGYHAHALAADYHDYAFFPLYPMLVRFLSLATPAFQGLIAVLLSNVLFLVVLGLLYLLTNEVLDQDRALTSCVYLAIFPFSFVFSMAYAESLFLALSLGSLLAAEHGRASWAGALASLAGATRAPGVLLIVPLALILWRRGRDRRSLLWLLLVPVGAGLFYLFVAHLTGSLGGYEAAESAWGRGGAASAVTTRTFGYGFDVLRGSILLTLVGFVFLLVYLRPDGIPLPYALLPILTIGSVLVSGNVASVGRYAMIAFPFVWVLAGRRRAFTRSWWQPASAGLLALVAMLSFGGFYLP